MMRPQTDPARRCLPVAEWPEVDRIAWHLALADDPLSIQRSTAATWRWPTRHKNRRGYGRWLHFLRNSDADLSVPPADRVTTERIAAYLTELRAQGVACYTLRNRILELTAVMHALAPDRDWEWLKACGVYLDRQATDTLDRSPPPLLAADIISRGMSELQSRIHLPASGRGPVEYRNWLMVTILAHMPLRLRNFAALSVSRHMTRRADVWWIDIEGGETKTGRPHAALLPSEVGKYLDHYVDHIRPQLNRRADCDSLWLSRSGSPLAEHTVYLVICRLTQNAFDMPINPHLFRHIFATSVSVANPEAIEGARSSLGHAIPRTTQQHYNRASSLTAARIHVGIVQRLRGKTISRRRLAKGK
jgi:site-specific recombinase XerD